MFPCSWVNLKKMYKVSIISIPLSGLDSWMTFSLCGNILKRNCLISVSISHPSIKFTYRYSNEKATFLDVDISKNSDGILDTSVHVKKTNNHPFSYL